VVLGVVAGAGDTAEDDSLSTAQEIEADEDRPAYRADPRHADPEFATQPSDPGSRDTDAEGTSTEPSPGPRAQPRRATAPPPTRHGAGRLGGGPRARVRRVGEVGGPVLVDPLHADPEFVTQPSDPGSLDTDVEGTSTEPSPGERNEPV